MTDAAGPSPRRQFYGRRQGHRLRPGQRALVAGDLPRRLLHLPATGLLDPAAAFVAPVADVWLEIGFGGGEHLAAQAQAHPDIGVIGCEPFLNGVARLLAHLESAAGDNVRLFPDDARLLLAVLPDACIGRLFLLFPDPWPKRRHHKRRFVAPETLDEVARVMKDGAEFRFATDHAGYARWTLFHVLRHPAFAWTAERADDWRVRPDDWPPTRYEAKAVEDGRAPVFLRFLRRPRT